MSTDTIIIRMFAPSAKTTGDERFTADRDGFVHDESGAIVGEAEEGEWAATFEPRILIIRPFIPPASSLSRQ